MTTPVAPTRGSLPWTRPKLTSALVCGLAWLAVAACGGAAPQTHHYRLVVEAGEKPQSETAPRMVLSSFEADPSFEDERMVYRKSEFRLDYDAYNRWTVAPRLLVTTFLRNAYVQKGYFSWVGDFSQEAGLPVLSGRVIALEEVASAKGSLAHVELALWLRSADGQRTLWSERVRREEPMEARGPEALAAATSRALNLAVNDTGPALASIAQTELERTQARSP